MDLKIHESWRRQLKEEFKELYYHKLIAYISEEYASNICYPQKDDIFAAFNHCLFESTKIVIIGQDPYHGPGQANGLCFSVKDGIQHPPSLKNIFKEIESDLEIPYPKSGNLERWSKQGVLLLNATLTVREHQPGSHQKKGWEEFTDAVIRKLSDGGEDIIFLLWGGFAKKKAKLINHNKHHVLSSGHPSPLSANRGYWFGNKHFSESNGILNQLQKTPIDW